MPHAHVQAADGSGRAALVIADEDSDTVALMPIEPGDCTCEQHAGAIALIAAEDGTDGEEVRVMLTRIDLLALVEKGQALLEGRLQ